MVTVVFSLMVFIGQGQDSGKAEGAALLQRLSEAARKNRLAAEKFLFTEEITRSRKDVDGEKVLSRRTYEVSFLEGENYYRLTGANGEPLPIDMEMAEQERFHEAEQYRRRTPLEERRKIAAKQERNRLKFDLESLPQTHHAQIIGKSTVNGRSVTIADISPAGRPRKPRNRNQWGRILAGRMWVDDETGYPVRAEMRQVIEWDSQPKGNETVFEWIRLEDAWLISLIRNVEPGFGGGVLVTSQNYSAYSRFQAESKITFTAVP